MIKSWRKLFFISGAIVMPFVSTMPLVACSNEDQPNTSNDKNDNQNKEPTYATKERQTTYFLNNFLLRKPNCGDTALKELTKQVRQDKLYSWDVYNDSLTFNERLISSGIGTLYLDENNNVTSTRTQYEIPPLNFYGKDIRFVTGGNYTQEGDEKKFIPKIVGHYEIDNVYVNWSYKNGEKINKYTRIGTISIYAAQNPNDIREQLAELQKESRPVIHQDVYLEFYEKVNGHPL